MTASKQNHNAPFASHYLCPILYSIYHVLKKVYPPTCSTSPEMRPPSLNSLVCRGRTILMCFLSSKSILTILAKVALHSSHHTIFCHNQFLAELDTPHFLLHNLNRIWLHFLVCCLILPPPTREFYGCIRL